MTRRRQVRERIRRNRYRRKKLWAIYDFASVEIRFDGVLVGRWVDGVRVVP